MRPRGTRPCGSLRRVSSSTDETPPGGADAGSPRFLLRRIVASYDSVPVRIYSRIRFSILRQVFLEEIGQYLPREGRVLDIGCGFGLFSLYFASLAPGCRLTGVDRDARRIGFAQESARRLGLDNAEYHVGDAPQWSAAGPFDAVYLLDLIHHLPVEEVEGFLVKLRGQLSERGVLVVKDVEDRPRWKMAFTLLLDRLMVGREPIHYWPADEFCALLERLGFEVVRHRMRDFLPYPHILYVARRSS